MPDGQETCEVSGAEDFLALLDEASADYVIPATDPEDLALLHFTSGTTGLPKGVLHVHDAAVVHYVTARFALDLRPDDIYWCTADPGWMTGTSYGLIAPLLIGATTVLDAAEYDHERWYNALQDEQVTVWYTAPTAVRMLMTVDNDEVERYDFSALRFIASVGEPLYPEAVIWGQEKFGIPFHDNWWQTETGGIMIANYATMDIKPGAMGKPIPGVEAAIVSRDIDGVSIHFEQDNTQGELAIRSGWPSMFRGYVGELDRYEA